MLASAIVVACAGPAGVPHSFNFENLDADAEILYYQYGDDTSMPTRPSPQEMARGKVAQSSGVYGTFSPARELVVRWRIRSTGEVRQEQVSLARIDANAFRDNVLFFAIEHGELLVVLHRYTAHAPEQPDCPLRVRRSYQCTVIYPRYFTNF